MASSASHTPLRPTTHLGEHQDCLIACLQPLPEICQDKCPFKGCSPSLCQVTWLCMQYFKRSLTVL